MNPHPTRSKPCKIGRKHTGQKRQKAKQKRLRGMQVYEKLKIARKRKYDAKVAMYFRNEIPLHPGDP